MELDLMEASKEGLLDVVRRRLEEGADPNQVDGYARTPLLYASFYRHVEVVRELLAAGADPNKVDYDGRTLLHNASTIGLVEVVRELLAAGADPTRADNRGLTPLQIAERKGYNECVLLLGSALEPWSPDNHALFPPAFRAAVCTVMCVHNRRPELVGDVELWLHVLSFAGREWFGAPAPATNEG